MWLGAGGVLGLDGMGRWPTRTGTQDAGHRGSEPIGMARGSMLRCGFGPSITLAGRGPAARTRSLQPWCFGERHHDESILIGLVGRVRGVEPRSKVSMMIMGPPQHGHGGRDVGGSSALTSASPGLSRG